MSTETPLQSTSGSRWIKRLGRLLGWLEAVLDPVMNPIRVLWLTGFCTAFFAVGVIFFLINDQGMDVLCRLVEARGWRGLLGNLFFFASVLAWALSTWYSGRLLLTRRFQYTDTNFFQATRTLRTWLPRIEGSVVPFVIAGGFWRVGSWGDAGTVPYILVAVYVALGISLFVFFWRRRAMFPAMMKGSAPDEVVDRLPPASLTTLWIAFALSWGLLILFLISPLSAPTLLGASAILLFAAASWILFGSMVITYWPMASGYPALTLPLIFVAIVAGFLNDNHTIRSTEVREPATAREIPETHFRNWLGTRLEGQATDRPYPLFVVASAGGGIRAAYWTTSVLGRIADANGEKWSDHLYAMSGVSGGSVGAALHAVQIAEQIQPSPAQSNQREGLLSFVERARVSLDNDLLSPAAAYMLFPDLVQRFVPFPVPFADRARAIELSMDAAAADPHGVNSNRFARRFVELWSDANRYRIPVLLLNTTVVETGQRAIISNLQIDNTFIDTVDLLGADKQTGNMPLSTAAHLSARFTYVSPAGTIRTPEGKLWGHIVDGGYFENSGAASAAELMQKMQTVADAVGKEKSRKVSLMLILIRNDSDATDVCRIAQSAPRQPVASERLNELFSPVRALLNTREARGRLAEQDAVDFVRRLHGGTVSAQSSQCEAGCVFEFGLMPEAIEPPLGWSLSRASRDSMNRQLETHSEKFACIGQLLAGGRCEQPPSCIVQRLIDKPVQ